MRFVVNASSDESESESNAQASTSSARPAPRRVTSGRFTAPLSSDSSDSDEIEALLTRPAAGRAKRAVRATTESPKQTTFFSPVKPDRDVKTPARQLRTSRNGSLGPISSSRRHRMSLPPVSPLAQRRRAEWDLVGRDEHASLMARIEQESMNEGNAASLVRLGELRRQSELVEQHLRDAEAAHRARDQRVFESLLSNLHTQYEQEGAAIAARREARKKRTSLALETSIVEAERQFRALQMSEEADRQKRADEAKARAEREQAERDRRERDAEVARLEAEKVRLDKEARDKADAADAAAAADAARARATEAKQAADAKKQAAGAAAAMGDSWKHWVERQQWMRAHVIEPVKADDDALAGLRKDMRIITRSIGQIINTREVVLRVADRQIKQLHEILIARLPVAPTASAPTRLEAVPREHAFLLSHLSKALIKQAETEVSANMDAAFPLGRVVVGLLLRGHTAFADVFFARLVKKCPWVVPFFPRKTEAKADYDKSIGRRAGEALSEYIDRSAAILTLYLAVVQTPLQSQWPSQFEAPGLEPRHLPALVPPPLRFTAAWSWLATATRDPLHRTELAARLMHVFINVLGAEYCRVYARQAHKVFHMVLRAAQAKQVGSDTPAAAVRLELALEDWKKGKVVVPKARQWE